MITSVAEYEKLEFELRDLTNRLDHIQRSNLSLCGRPATVGLRRLIAGLHEELAAYEDRGEKLLTPLTVERFDDGSVVSQLATLAVTSNVNTATATTDSAESVLTVEGLGKAYPRWNVKPRHTTSGKSVFRAVSECFRPRPAEQLRYSWALRGVSFSVSPGELVGVVGQYGSGKTTLVKILSRIAEPAEGSVRVRGRVAAMIDAKTDFDLELTARENVFFRGAILGMTRREIGKRMGDIFDFADQQRFADTPVKYFSLGMTTCLSFAITAHLDSEILLVDEGLSFAAPQYGEKCMGRLRQVSEVQRRAVLFVSHDMAAIRQLCPRTIRLKDGQVIADGATEEIIRTYQTSL